jgi:hypothetical protein
MFYKPEKYIIPSNRRTTKRIQINSSQVKDKVNSNIQLQERLRENKQVKLKDIMNSHKEISGAESIKIKPRRYNENNSFDYSDVNVSRRIIRKMVQSNLFDHRPYEKAKYLDKISLGNKFLSKVDNIGGVNSSNSMNFFDKHKPLNSSVDFRGSGMLKYAKTHKTLETAGPNNYNRPSRRQMSQYSNIADGRASSSTLGATSSLKDFHSCGPFAGVPTNKGSYNMNRAPFLKVMNDVYKTMNASSDQIMSANILGGNPLMNKSSHYRSNDRVFSNPYQSNGL